METCKCVGTINKCLTVFCTLLLLVLAGVACTEKVSYEELVKQKLAEIFPAPALNVYRCIVLVPNGGCTGCVQEAENFFLQNEYFSFEFEMSYR